MKFQKMLDYILVAVLQAGLVGSLGTRARLADDSSYILSLTVCLALTRSPLGMPRLQLVQEN
jgi:hypothetical protein